MGQCLCWCLCCSNLVMSIPLSSAEPPVQGGLALRVKGPAKMYIYIYIQLLLRTMFSNWKQGFLETRQFRLSVNYIDPDLRVLLRSIKPSVPIALSNCYKSPIFWNSRAQQMRQKCCLGLCPQLEIKGFEKQRASCVAT